MVQERKYKGQNVRMLLMNGAAESASFVDPEKRNELPFAYTREFNRIFDFRPDSERILLLGGAGFSYPKYILTHHTEVYIDVVEIDPLMPDLAEKFFYLNEIEDRSHMEIIIDDANSYISKCKIKYDAIINDAYIEDCMEKGLRSDRAVTDIKRCLKDGGIYVHNVIGALTGIRSMQGTMVHETVRQHFKYVEYYAVDESKPTNRLQNCMLFASDERLIER